MPGGGIINGVVQSAMDGLMREIWTGTLALLRAVLGLVGELGTIDITPGGGAISNELWTTMLQLAGVIAMILFFAQLAATALNPRRNLFQATTGPLQYGIALALSVALVAALLGAADGLSSIILTQGANVTDTAAAMDQLGLVDDNNAVKAVVLGFLGIIGVLPLAIGYGITLLFRSASILVLVATLPITAAGLTNLATKHWFWRVSRWMLALIFLKPAFALCFALGSGIVAAAGRTEGPAAPAAPGAEAVAPADGSGIVTLLLGLGIMFVALFAPYALFRLFAFIEPGTQPHQAMMSAFSSAMAGARSSASGIATADVGSVLSGATGGRFAGGGGGGGAGGALAGLGGGSGPDGSGGAGGGTKQQAVAAGLAMATGGTSAAAGAAGAGAGAGAGGTAASGAAASSAGASSSGAVGGATRALAGVGGGARDGATPQGEAEERDGEHDALAGAGAAAHDTGGPQLGESSEPVAAPAYAGAGAGGARSGGGPVGSSAGGASAGGASAGGAGGAAAGGGAGGSAGGASGGGSISGGSWSIAGAASAAAVAARGYGGGRVGHAADVARGVAGGFSGAAGAIAGSAPMRAAPMGGAVGSTGGGPNNTPDYGGGYFHGSGRSSYPARGAERSDDGYSGSYYPPLRPDDDGRGPIGGGYRDESFDDDHTDHDDGRHDGGDDEDQGMSGVLR